jgi:hypothetical protein
MSSSSDLDQLIKDYLETKIGAPLDYFAIENRMSTDASGDMGVTGSYRKKASNKNVFFTITINLATHKIRNLQEY